MLLHVLVVDYFVLLSSVSLYIPIYYRLLIHFLVRVVSYLWLLGIKFLRTAAGKSLFSFLLGRYLEVRPPGHMVSD